VLVSGFLDLPFKLFQSLIQEVGGGKARAIIYPELGHNIPVKERNAAPDAHFVRAAVARLCGSTWTRRSAVNEDY